MAPKRINIDIDKFAQYWQNGTNYAALALIFECSVSYISLLRRKLFEAGDARFALRTPPRVKTPANGSAASDHNETILRLREEVYNELLKHRPKVNLGAIFDELASISHMKTDDIMEEAKSLLRDSGLPEHLAPTFVKIAKHAAHFMPASVANNNTAKVALLRLAKRKAIEAFNREPTRRELAGILDKSVGWVDHVTSMDRAIAVASVKAQGGPGGTAEPRA